MCAAHFGYGKQAKPSTLLKQNMSRKMKLQLMLIGKLHNLYLSNGVKQRIADTPIKLGVNCGKRQSGLTDLLSVS
jgi:hypothetical protein